ncbi:MAG: glycosyltransferase family 4 protein [Flavobacteriaceae bacterium]
MSSKSGKLLVIGHVWPEPLATAAGKRMLQLLDFWQDRGADISFASAAIKTEYSFDLSSLGIEEIPICLNDPSFDRMICKQNPDIVMFDRFMTEEQYGWRVAEQLPNCIRILNTEDLHSLRQARGAHIDQPPADLSRKWLEADTTKRELASIYRSDLSLIISTFEEKWLRSKAGVPQELLAYLPFMYDTSAITQIEKLPGYKDRRDFVFVGNGKHQPNLDAIAWLKNELWPVISGKLPDIDLHIYGAYLPLNILDLNDPDTGFLVHGWIEDIRSVLKNCRVNLVPLRYGAGLKGKLLEAMLCGTPSIATHIGMEGISGVDDDSITRFIKNESFTEKAIDLYCNKEVWETQRSAELEIVGRQFSTQPHYSRIIDRLEYLSKNLFDHRHQNVVGSILSHQTLNSTKYMAKWIEAKNKQI